MDASADNDGPAAPAAGIGVARWGSAMRKRSRREFPVEPVVPVTFGLVGPVTFGLFVLLELGVFVLFELGVFDSSTKLPISSNSPSPFKSVAVRFVVLSVFIAAGRVPRAR